MSTPYDVMAAFYDRVNGDIDYERWADFIEAQFGRFAKEKPSLVLDLAAGTGSMTVALAKRGYDMIAVDISEEMLAVAAERVAEAELSGVLLLRQDMTRLDLYGTVDAVVCCLDSINHLTKKGEVETCFSLVHNFLNPDGLFLFDVNTPYTFRTVYGERDLILSDGEGTLCCWQNSFCEKSGICRFDLAVFTEEKDGRYRREDTVQKEKCFTRRELTKRLRDANFEVLGFFGDRMFGPVKRNTPRWYVAARAKKR